MGQEYRPGSRQDFDRLYQTAYPRVFRTLFAILGDRQAAEDCSQDAFVQAFQAWNRWKPDAPAEAWVHRIAVNRAISYRRRARIRTVTETLLRIGRPAQAEDPADAAARSDVMSALQKIPPKLAAAIVLRHYHGYNNREIAAALGVSERTVGTRLLQAGQRLRALLEPSFSLAPGSAFSSDKRESYAED
ncbi:MAG TPA: RNA polymerase sigma factor [Candidatus Dormibacteraeota bacterium]|nr:RNA polymerase sigma factor [Candidatus Dormibacteraeota bacterium]